MNEGFFMVPGYNLQTYYESCCTLLQTCEYCLGSQATASPGLEQDGSNSGCRL